MYGRLARSFSEQFEAINHKDTKGTYVRIPWEIYIALVESELKVSEVLREGLFCLLHEGHLVLEGINDQQEERRRPSTQEVLQEIKQDKSWEAVKI